MEKQSVKFRWIGLIFGWKFDPAGRTVVAEFIDYVYGTWSADGKN
jgi:hypothetical protein